MENIKELRERIKILERGEAKEKYKHVCMFNEKINELINKTPTSELRNDITDLNILFHLIIDPTAFLPSEYLERNNY